MAKIICFLSLFFLLHAEIIEIERMEQILPYVDETTWVLFDIDDMLIESELQVERANRTPEPEIPSIVCQVQQSAGAVFGLSARHPPVCATTLKQLAYIGIDFTFSAPFCHNLETQIPTHWEGGVLFISDFNRKGEVFRKWLEISPIRPSKIVLIDDGKNNLIMEKQMAEFGIPSTCFHYIKAAMRLFDPEIGE